MAADWDPNTRSRSELGKPAGKGIAGRGSRATVWEASFGAGRWEAVCKAGEGRGRLGCRGRPLKPGYKA